MTRLETIEMYKMLLMLVCAGALAGISAAAQDTAKTFPFPSMSEGITYAVPVGELNVYESQPSKWFGNAFNTNVGTVDTSEKFQIVDYKLISSFKGPKVWVELQPLGTDEGEQCNNGCWAYLGNKDSSISIVEGNNTGVPLIEGEESAINYGNFLFIESPS